MKRLGNILIYACMVWTAIAIATGSYRIVSLWLAAAAVAGYIAVAAGRRSLFAGESQDRQDTAR